MKRLLPIAVAAAAVWQPFIARAWDHAGHMLVSEIAWEKAAPATRERVSALAQLLPAQHNGNHPYNAVTIGCWMDDMRAEPGYAWAKWHYVNVPWTADGKEFQLPPPPHVVWAIDEARGRLKDPQLAPEKQAEALAMLVHFVGDLHQPMHATERNDRGGNGFLISGVPFSTLSPKKPETLHFFWDAVFRSGVQDGKIVEAWKSPDVTRRPTAPGEGVIGEQAAKLLARFPADQLPELNQPLTPEQWARESHELGCRVGYPEGEEPSDTEIHPIKPEFVERSEEIAGRRIVLAGLRLAAVLDELFAPDPTREGDKAAVR